MCPVDDGLLLLLLLSGRSVFLNRPRLSCGEQKKNVQA